MGRDGKVSGEKMEEEVKQQLPIRQKEERREHVMVFCFFISMFYRLQSYRNMKSLTDLLVA